MRQTLPLKPLYTTHDVARMIQVDASTVSKWIDKGTLLAFRTPGGHRRVRQGDLRGFLQAHKMPVPEELGEGRFRLLILDDERPVVESLKRALRHAAPQVEVVGTTSGIEALLMLGEDKPDAALIDLTMPAMDGYEVCRAVRAQKRLGAIKLVTMTARLTPQAIEKSREAGALECLGKPVNPPGLLSLLGVAATPSHSD